MTHIDQPRWIPQYSGGQIVGSCSICGGQVTVPFLWLGVNPPVARCSICGAVRKSELPMIEMVPADSVSYSDRCADSTAGNPDEGLTKTDS